MKFAGSGEVDEYDGDGSSDGESMDKLLLLKWLLLKLLVSCCKIRLLATRLVDLQSVKANNKD